MTCNLSHYIIGIDGGGSGCRAALSDSDGVRIGEATGGAANFTTNPELAIKSVLEAAQEAAKSADIELDTLSHCVAHVGLAGILNASGAARMAAALPFRQVNVTDDRPTSTVGALGTEDGLLAAIGTGAFVAIQKNGAARFFGGWGFQISDHGSGAWLGRAAMERCLNVCDGLEPGSVLSNQVLTEFHNDPVEMVSFAKAAAPSDFAALAPMVIKAGAKSDALGRSIMTEGARFINSCIGKADLGESDIVCLTGGIGPHYAPYLDDRAKSLVRPAKGTALDGALMLAKAASENMECAG
ncbi:MAG: N-acetylglucosamine kinase [Boseongicola sp.]|nr:MAG: N-acetylglucosamine kinase [Boseongicola sp.]